MTDKTKLGKYEILEELGRGGFGVVYKARDAVLDRVVAVKVLHPNLVNDPGFVSRFRNEARLAAQLDHSNIVSVYDFGEYQGLYYIAMAYMPGGSLKDMLQKEGALPEKKALTILNQVADGLSYAHKKGIIHRDLKPGNILFDEEGAARVSDLGFAKALHTDSSVSLSMSGGLVGTPAYMAPEVWRGEPATPQTDIYSLGCILYEMLTDEVLFEGKTPAEVMTKHLIDGPVFNAQLSGPVRQVIDKALATLPANRHSSIEELSAELLTLGKATSLSFTDKKSEINFKSGTSIGSNANKPKVDITPQSKIAPGKKSLIWVIAVFGIMLLFIGIWVINMVLKSVRSSQLQTSISKPTATMLNTQPAAIEIRPAATIEEPQPGIDISTESVSSPAQERLAASLGESEFDIGTTRTVKVKELLNIENVSMLGISPDERFVAVGDEQTVYIYQLNPLDCIKTIHISDFIPEDPNGVTDVVFSRNQRYMAIRTNFDIAVFEQGSWNYLYRFGAGVGKKIEFVGDTPALANLHLQNVYFKNLETQEELGDIAIISTGRLSADAGFTMSPDGKYVIGYSTEEDGFIKIFEYASKREVAKINNLGWFRNVIVSKDSSMVMALISETEVWVWNLADGKFISRTGFDRNIRSADFTPEGNLLIQFEDKTAIIEPLIVTNMTNYNMEGLQFDFESVGFLELSTSRRLGWSKENDRLRIFSLNEVIFWN
ncbi:MAG: WD40 repeat domain-containing serine/threonine protein kinase [Chloroflexota bacterium]|jgi:serine/threonine protein kinase|nr:WD40 repeat domain-containing serine/threonine protein kinase [Chloroflexota bacterium]